MSSSNAPRQPIALFREAVNSYIAHPIILVPFITIAFFQLLVLEIIYFSARFPLVKFFGPIIQRLEGEAYLHYPQHLLIIPKWFQTAQYFFYVFISSFLVAVAIEIIAACNNNKKIKFPLAVRSTLPCYVHIVLAALLTFLVFAGMSKGYGLLMERALQIRSQDGVFYIIKTTILQGAPYFNLLIGVLATTAFAFVYPIIVIDRKKIFPAFALNFKYLLKSLGMVFLLVLIPTLFYVPFLLLRNNLSFLGSLTFAEAHAVLIVAGILIMALIDATVYTAVTVYYLLRYKES